MTCVVFVNNTMDVSKSIYQDSSLQQDEVRCQATLDRSEKEALAYCYDRGGTRF